MKGMTKIGANGKRLPKDVKIIGGLVIATGLFFILLAVEILSGIATVTIMRPGPGLYLLDVVRIESDMEYAITFLIFGVVNIAGGLGLMRGYPWAWWFQWFLFVAGIPNYFVVGGSSVGYKVGSLVLKFLFALWLFSRVRVYKPFGQKKGTVGK